MSGLLALLALAACGGAAPSADPAPGPAATPAAAAPSASSPGAPATNATATAPAAASGVAHGRSIVEGRCTGCHGLDVYTRPDHKMQDAAMLDAQVDTCGDAAGLDDASKQDVKDYLAKEVYGFAG